MAIPLFKFNQCRLHPLLYCTEAKLGRGEHFRPSNGKKSPMTLFTSQDCSKINRVGKRIQFLSFPPIEEGGLDSIGLGKIKVPLHPL